MVAFYTTSLTRDIEVHILSFITCSIIFVCNEIVSLVILHLILRFLGLVLLLWSCLFLSVERLKLLEINIIFKFELLLWLSLTLLALSLLTISISFFTFTFLKFFLFLLFRFKNVFLIKIQFLLESLSLRIFV